MKEWIYSWPWEEYIVPIVTFGFRAPWTMALIGWRRRAIVQRVNAQWSS